MELGVSEATIRRRIRAGDIPAVRLGGPRTSLRVSRRELEAWLWSTTPEQEG